MFESVNGFQCDHPTATTAPSDWISGFRCRPSRPLFERVKPARANVESCPSAQAHLQSTARSSDEVETSAVGRHLECRVDSPTLRSANGRARPVPHRQRGPMSKPATHPSAPSCSERMNQPSSRSRSVRHSRFSIPAVTPVSHSRWSFRSQASTSAAPPTSTCHSSP